MRFFRDISVASVTVLPFLSLPERSYAAEGGGLPQLDTSLFPEQIFWLAVSFVVLYLMMAKIALPRVAKTQDSRKRIISSDLETARKMNDSAKATLASVEKSLISARNKAHAEVAGMLNEIASKTAATHAAQEKEQQQRLQKAEADIGLTRDAALKAILASANDLAGAVVEKIVGSKLRVES